MSINIAYKRFHLVYEFFCNFLFVSVYTGGTKIAYIISFAITMFLCIMIMVADAVLFWKLNSIAIFFASHRIKLAYSCFDIRCHANRFPHASFNWSRTTNTLNQRMFRWIVIQFLLHRDHPSLPSNRDYGWRWDKAPHFHPFSVQNSLLWKSLETVLRLSLRSLDSCPAYLISW